MKPTDAERDLAFDRLIARGLAGETDVTGNACPDADLLAAWFDRSLSASETERIEAHAAACASCQQILADLARSEPPVVRAAPVPAPAKPWHWHWRWLVPVATRNGDRGRRDAHAARAGARTPRRRRRRWPGRRRVSLPAPRSPLAGQVVSGVPVAKGPDASAPGCEDEGRGSWRGDRGTRSAGGPAGSGGADSGGRCRRPLGLHRAEQDGRPAAGGRERSGSGRRGGRRSPQAIRCGHDGSGRGKRCHCRTACRRADGRLGQNRGDEGRISRSVEFRRRHEPERQRRLACRRGRLDRPLAGRRPNLAAAGERRSPRP